ncbi:MAG TPA: peptide chain release factor N(5)-glutamine methyltransferase [Pseudolabrys sp.]|nr:peptide chain release factor N(5)-glutamine methyltransferase [Pseudolabrys sp.]
MRIIPGLKAGACAAEAVQLIAQSFRFAGIEAPEADARLLLAHALRLNRTQLAAQWDRILEARETDAVSALAARRLRREPVARILGVKEFWSLPLVVTPAVLVPRPETETVVEAALDALGQDGTTMESLRILDIGTGSGALLLALLKELPKAIGLGTDISEAALDVARLNAERNGLKDRCTFIACDIAAGVQGWFDLIVSNPPYIGRNEIASLAPEVREFEPMEALDGGNDGLAAYRAIAPHALRLLTAGGRLFVELGAGQESPVAALFTKAGLRVIGTRKDLAGIPRVLGATAAAMAPSHSDCMKMQPS